jgi:hypothetical protein
MIIFSFDEGMQFSATRSGMSGHAGMVMPVAYWIYLRVIFIGRPIIWILLVIEPIIPTSTSH